jgi:hypothetical protein
LSVTVELPVSFVPFVLGVNVTMMVHELCGDTGVEVLQLPPVVRAKSLSLELVTVIAERLSAVN